MTPEQLVYALKTSQAVEFEDTIAVLDAHFDYSETAFKNGEQSNEAGQNAGSCKVLAFGQLMNLSEDQVLRAFGRFYQSVLDTPDGVDHSNIRNFMRYGWEQVSFAAPPLKYKGHGG